MHRKKLFATLIAAGVLILAVTGIVLAAAQPAKAQCGSQASSCKNCHETQAKKPVNNDGTDWHQAHAFGDFCYICHGGNQQATDQNAAHLGLVSPLADVNASCAQCHPNDTQARAQKFATTLGIDLATSGQAASVAPSPTAAASAPTAVAVAQAAAPAPASVASSDSDLVDYVARYNEDVLGQHPTNWGNVILAVLLAALLLGGGFIVMQREGWIRIAFKETQPLGREYPPEVVELAAEIAAMKPDARASLRRLLGRPEAAELFSVVDRMSQNDGSQEDESQTSE